MTSHRPSFAPSITLALLFTMSFALGTAAAADRGEEAAAAELQAKADRVQNVIDDLRARLSLTRGVVAAIVPQNPLRVSVLSPVERGGAYRIAFEGDFLDALSAEELRAVVAHELGHVWIFTHHPYLQTEQLANKIALRVIPRETLERVYTKVWPHGVPTGAPVRFSIPAN
jgi:hypothetical protein